MIKKINKYMKVYMQTSGRILKSVFIKEWGENEK